MMRKVVFVCLCALFLSSIGTLMANPAMELSDAGINNVIQPIGNRTIRLVGANGEMLEIFNLTGVKVAQVQVDSPDKVITLDLAKGCYILKVSKVVRKVFIQ